MGLAQKVSIKRYSIIKELNEHFTNGMLYITTGSQLSQCIFPWLSAGLMCQQGAKPLVIGTKSSIVCRAEITVYWLQLLAISLFATNHYLDTTKELKDKVS